MSIIEVKYSLPSWLSKEDKRLFVVEFYSFSYAISIFIINSSDGCKTIARPYNILARRYTNVVFMRLNVDNLGRDAQQYNVQAIPTFIFFYQGEEENRIITEDIQQVEDEINRILSAKVENSSEAQDGRFQFMCFTI